MSEPYNSAASKPWQPVNSIPIAKAVLCANCDCVTEAKNGHCLACGSHSIVNLEKLLNHDVIPAPPPPPVKPGDEPGEGIQMDSRVPRVKPGGGSDNESAQ